MKIREFAIGDASALYQVFYSSVHELANQHYTLDQLNAWAPQTVDPSVWSQRMQEIRPLVVEVAGRVVAYADVQSNGYIDHSFLAGSHARQGIGSALMQRLHEVAATQAIDSLSSLVSRTAQPFFGKSGFIIVEHRSPLIRGAVVPNALMRKKLVRR